MIEDDIRTYADSLGFKADANGMYNVDNDNDAYRIYSHASTKGYSGADLDSAFRWAPGGADGWAKKQGLAALVRKGTGTTVAGTPAPAPAPAPAPVTAPAPAPGATPAPAPVTSIMDRASSSAANAVATTAPAPPPYEVAASRVGQAAQTGWDESMSAAGRAASIMDQGGPLMEVARNRGNAEAAARGMLGSTMGIEAAQKAMIENAMPLATTDANNFAQIGMSNTAQSNAWDTADLNRNQSDRQFGASLSENARQANLGATTQLTIAGMNYDVADRRLTQEDQQFLKTYDMESRKLDTQIAQFAQQFGLSVQQLELDKGKLSQQDRQYYDGMKLERDKLTQQADQFNRDWENKFSLETMASKNRIDLANIDANNRKDLMAVEAAYKKDISGNETISGAWGTMMQEIGRIQNNPDLEAGAKTTLINNAMEGFKSFTSFWKKASGGSIDVADLLNFKVSAPAPAPADNTGVNTGTGNNTNGGDGL